MNTETLKNLIVETIEELQGDEVAVLDVRPFALADYFVIASIRSNRQAAAMQERLRERLKEKNLPFFGIEGEKTDWTLIDAGDVVVHLMSAETRRLYDLESLWGLE